MASATTSARASFVAASDAGDLEGVRKGLDAGVDVDCDTGGGWTCLLDAASNGHTAIARLVIQRGAHLNHRNVRRAPCAVIVRRGG